MVSVLAFNSDDSCLNPADVYSFSVKFVFETNENKPKMRPELPIFIQISPKYIFVALVFFNNSMLFVLPTEINYISELLKCFFKTAKS